MQSRWIEHKGARILYVDFCNFGQDLDGLAVEIRAISVVVEQEPEDSVLGMADVRGTVLSREVASLLKESAPLIGRHIVKTAVVMDQITGFKKVIFDAIGRVSGQNTMLFDDVEEAQDWLADGE